MSSVPEQVDVAIIGGGFAGMSTAWALARAGVRDTIVLEREPEIGRYASGRSAGLGRQLAEDDDTTALTVRGAALLREMPAAWAATGGILSFDDASHAEAYAARAAKFGVAVELADAGLVATRWPMLADLRVVRALWVPGDGVINVRALLAVFAQDIRIATSAPVEKIDAGPRVITPQGTIAAKVVVDASGAWAGEITGGEPLTSYKRHVFILDGELDAATPWLWHLGASELYVRADAEGVLASPCDAGPSQPGHQSPDLVGEAHLRRLLDDAGSTLGNTPITRRWACQRAFTESRKMRLRRDESRPWLVWAAGLGGHGATAAPAVGEAVAQEVIKALTKAA